jgi:acetyltransferase-like isoleucine patch superfamily enzyme
MLLSIANPTAAPQFGAKYIYLGVVANMGKEYTIPMAKSIVSKPILLPQGENIVWKNINTGEVIYILSVGDNCTIAENVTLGESIRLQSSITIRDGSKIGNNCYIQTGAVIGRDVYAGCRITFGRFSSVSDGAKIGNDANILPFSTVPSAEPVPENAVR